MDTSGDATQASNGKGPIRREEDVAVEREEDVAKDRKADDQTE